MKHLKTFEAFLNEKKPKGAPSWKDSDAPDAEGRFRDLGIKDLAAWLIKTRDGDLKKISGSLTQQVVFNRNEDPAYAEKMEKVRQEVYKQLGREDLMDKDMKNYTSWLQESFADTHPKNIYTELSADEVDEYADEIADLIKKAYADKGGNLEIRSGIDVKNGDITFWVAKDLDADPDADVVLGGKQTTHGTKMTVMGQDGGSQAKKDAILKMIELMKTRGFYAELSPDLAQKFGLSHIQDEKEIRKVLNKDVEMNSDGSYRRKITGAGVHTKVLVGLPK